MDPILGELTTQAATILMQNTASIVAEKVQSIKAKRNDKEAGRSSLRLSTILLRRMPSCRV